MPVLRHLAALALALLTCATCPALAQQPSAPPPAIPTSAFAARSPFSSLPTLSPDGERIAFSLEEDGKSWIGVIDFDRGALMRKIPLEEDQSLRWFKWVGKDRLLISLVVPITSNWAEGRVSRLFVADLATSQTY